jgi:hypothetical protein
MLNTSRLRLLGLNKPELRLLTALVDQGNENAHRKLYRDYAKNFQHLDLGEALNYAGLSSLEVIVAWEGLVLNGFMRREDTINYRDVSLNYWAMYCNIAEAWKEQITAKRLQELSRQNALNALPIFDRLTLTPEGIIFQ